MFIYALLTNYSEPESSHIFNHVSVTAFMSFEEATAKLYDWYNGQTDLNGETYDSEWREDKEKDRWFNSHFPECEIRRIYFCSPNAKPE
jgi:hypothetical protein